MPNHLEGAKPGLLLSFILVLSLSAGCGYQSYKAFYVTYDEYEEARTRDDVSTSYRSEDSLEQFEVWMSFWATFDDNTRSCFRAGLDFIGESGEASGSSTIAGLQPIADSAVITCEETGHLATLPLNEDYRNDTLVSFVAKRICIGRRRDKLVLSYHARLVSPEGETLEARKFDLRLHRWEDRNWLGLE